MKKLILSLISVLLFQFSYSQSNELSGCMGIKFGDTKEQVKQVISSKGGTFEVYKDEPKTLSYINGNFAGRDCIGFVFMFYNGKLHTIKVLLKEDKQPKVLDLYETVVDELKVKYQITPNKQHYFKSPYYEGDGYTASAIKMGYAELYSYFNFEDGNVISVTITQGLTVMLTYQQTQMAKEDIGEFNKKRSQDY